MDNIVSTSVKSKKFSNSHEEMSLIKRHLKESSFSAFITWRGRTCTIKNLDLFTSIVLTTLNPALSLDQFHEKITNSGLEISENKQTIKITFPSTRNQIIPRLSHTSSILKEFDLIELKQEKLFKMILKAKEKLERALKINSTLKMELNKSEIFQKNMIAAHADKIFIKEYDTEYTKF